MYKDANFKQVIPELDGTDKNWHPKLLSKTGIHRSEEWYERPDDGLPWARQIPNGQVLVITILGEPDESLLAIGQDT